MNDRKEKALVIYIKDTREKHREEMIELVKACDMEVQEVFDVNVRKITNATYIGKGKCVEIHEWLQDHECDVIIFSKELSPLQSRNLEKMLEHVIMDRSTLILEIFSKRASTREAKLQIEAAQLRSLLPKLAGSTSYLGRQSGGGQNKGVGEKQIELDKRVIKKRIAQLSSQLKQLEKQRAVRSRFRQGSHLPLVSLIGYTNAGKSTIMNQILSNSAETKKVFAKDMLFATLDTSVRKVSYQRHEFLLSDTVGFVSDLPHDLIEAFHSTLEEISDADLLVQVIDMSDEFYEAQMKITKDTLKTIHAANIPMIYVFNKADKTNTTYPIITAQGIHISALYPESIQMLLSYISDALYPIVSTELFIPYCEAALIQECEQDQTRYFITYEEDGARVHFRYQFAINAQFKPFIVIP